MSINQTWNGMVYPIPTQGDLNWAAPLDRYLIALGTYALSPAGGNFTLTANVNFGASFGLLAAYFSGRGTVGSTGLLRLSKTDSIVWKNNAGSGNNVLATDSSDNLVYNSVVVPTGLATLADGKIWIGSSGNLPVAQTLMGDVTVTNAGVTSIGAGIIVNSQVNASAAIDYSKLNLMGSIVNNDIANAAAIAYSKLALTNSIVNNDINSAAAIAYSKLNLTGSVNLASDVTGNLSVLHLDSGTGASSSSFWRGDGTWVAPVTSLTGTASQISVSASTGAVTLSLPVPLGVTVGGTGLTTLAQGDILYGSASNTLLALTKDTNATRYLSNTGTTNNPAWAQIDLSNGVTGNLATSHLNSGTSASSSTFWRGDGTWATPSGSGTVNSGTTPRLAFYATSGTAVSDISADASMNSHKITDLANGTAATDAAAFGQIFAGFQAAIQSTTTSNTATTSNTFQTTALSASITPTSSSHRVKIIATGTGYVNTAGKSVEFSLFRGTTNLGDATHGFTAIIPTGATPTNLTTPVAMSFIDSPATTASTTYSVKLRSPDNATDVEFPAYGGMAVIILEEIV